MPSSDEPIARLPAHLAARRRRRLRAVGSLVLMCLLGGVIWARCAGDSRHQRAELQRAAEALTRAIGGETAAWHDVDEAYGGAARASLLGVDPYPLFVLELTQKLRAGESTAADPRVRAVITAIAAGELTSARAGLQSLPEDRVQAWLGRLIDDLEQASERLSATDPPLDITDP